jgi:hypothetical protein
MSCAACRNAPGDGRNCGFCGERCRHTVAREQEALELKKREVAALEEIAKNGRRFGGGE